MARFIKTAVSPSLAKIGDLATRLEYIENLLKPDTGPLRKNWSTVHLKVAETFNGEELRDLVTRLNGRWDFVVSADDTLPEQSLAVVLWVERHKLKRPFLELLRELRPNEDWPLVE